MDVCDVFARVCGRTVCDLIARFGVWTKRMFFWLLDVTSAGCLWGIIQERMAVSF